LLGLGLDVPQGACRIEVLGEEGGPKQVKVGLPWTEDEFFTKALTLAHPFDRPPVADAATVSAIKRISEMGPSGFELHLEKVIERVRTRKNALQDEEIRLHATFHKDVELVIADKQLLLLEELLAEIDHVDVSLAADIANGFDIAGEISGNGVFQMLPDAECRIGHPPSALLAQARARREVLAASIRQAGRTGDKVVVQAMRDESMAEVQKGRARGPYTEEHLDATLGPRWVGCKRFGLRQGGKIRPIDDYSDNCVNSCATLRDKVPLSDVDWVCNVVRCWERALNTEEATTLQDVEGHTVEIKPHPEWKITGVELEGGCFDLDDAYKQSPHFP